MKKQDSWEGIMEKHVELFANELRESVTKVKNLCQFKTEREKILGIEAVGGKVRFGFLTEEEKKYVLEVVYG